MRRATTKRSNGRNAAHGRGRRGARQAADPRPPREALLDAAVTLFGARGPAAVSTREVAAAARVNNGLIHRHFRTKDELLRAALNRLASEIAAAGPAADSEPDALVRYFDATFARGAYWRLLARALLDGRNPTDLQTTFPTMERIVVAFRRLEKAGALPPGLDPRAVAAALTAMGLGWLVFEPFLAQSTGLADEGVEQARRRVRHVGLALLRAIVTASR
jgi:AcrR family transcriptional regulator